MSAVNEALAALHGGRYDKAERLYRKALRADPEQPDALHGLGIIEHAAGRHERALGFFARAARAGVASSQFHNNRANALSALNRFEEALQALETALRLSPDDATLHFNRGNILLELIRFEEALDSFNRAITLNPGLRQAWLNKGLAETQTGRFRDALATCDRLIADTPEHLRGADPEYAKVRFNAAALCLVMGDFERGWAEYEARLQDTTTAQHVRSFPQPFWRGEDITGRRILLHAEQGFGDTIQFCRYAPLVAERGAEVVLDVPAPLHDLLRTLPGVTHLIRSGDKQPPCDVQAPLMSLPHIVGTRLETVPARIPYLAANPERIAHWRTVLGDTPHPRIGLAWSGASGFKNDATRSAPLAALQPLILPQFSYVAVQRDIRPADAEAVSALGIAAPGAAIESFADAAAIMTLCDLVISVDSAPAHLAGALGRDVWLLLHDFAEWRWLADGETSPWYPTARLFRQDAPRDWSGLASKVADALRHRFGVV